MSEGRRYRADVVVAVVLTLGVLGPALLKPGYVLRGDMVFVPDQPWKPAWLGLDGGVPRSVPMDAVVWLLDQLLPGDVVQKLLLAASLMILALGVAHLLRRLGPWARAAGMVMACWNPWVYERLAIGQWACVLGLATLPWLISALARRRMLAVASWLVVAAVAAPSMGLTAVVVAIAVTASLRVHPRDWLVLALLCLGANAPWIVPSLLRTGIDAPAGQFAGFSAHAESGAGTLASVVSLGGIWKTSVIPAERTSLALVLIAAAVCLASLVALARRRAEVPGAIGLLVAAVLSLLLAALPLDGLLADLASGVPAAGILRDSTRYLAPAVLAVALGFAVLVEAALRRSQAGVALMILPVALLPSMAWGLHGFLEPTQYPASWFAARQTMERAGGGSSVVLPWRGSYRGFPWTDGHAVLDPAPRFFPGEVLVDDRIFLAQGVLASEDSYLRRVGAALSAPDRAQALRALGIRWLISENGSQLDLIDLGPPAPSHRRTPPAWLVLAADIAAAGEFFAFFPVFLRRGVIRITVRST